MRTKLAIGLMVLLAGCAGGGVTDDGDGTVGAGIVGGKIDKGDPAVVLLKMMQPGNSLYYICSGEVVSPRVVLTAAHCVDPRALQLDFGNANPVQFQIVTHYDLSKAKADDILAVQEVHGDPQYDVNDPAHQHDIGVVILAQPTTIAPLPFNHLPLADGAIGKTVRQIGYGVKDGVKLNGAGIKRMTNTKLTIYDPTQVYFESDQHTQCHGDSGGPSLIDINGVETIIGISSWGPGGQCKLGSWDTRVDVLAPFVDRYIQLFDPAPLPPAPPTTPPTNPPAPPTPPTPPTNPPPPTTGGMCPSGSLSISSQSQNGQCTPIAGQPAGGACNGSDDCASVCCSCGDGTSYSVRVCANGQCLGQADACACFAQSNVCQ